MPFRKEPHDWLVADSNSAGSDKFFLLAVIFLLIIKTQSSTINVIPLNFYK
ncbi:hypothetical protein PUATCC27989T_02681 [Phytobacter ursingii]|nr:hypothetical protein PUATCC27989T_02681 [Phytobacter ursingii]